MRMCVNKTGQKRRIAKVNNPRTAWNRNTSACADGNDFVIGYDDDTVFYRFCARSVNHLRGFQNNRACAASFTRRTELLSKNFAYLKHKKQRNYQKTF